ncbi:hypothetical protein [Thiolapillus sp.]
MQGLIAQKGSGHCPCAQAMLVPLATTARMQKLEQRRMPKPGCATKAGLAPDIPSLLKNRMFSHPESTRGQYCRTLTGNTLPAARRLAANAHGVAEGDIASRRVN